MVPTGGGETSRPAIGGWKPLWLAALVAAMAVGVAGAGDRAQPTTAWAPADIDRVSPPASPGPPCATEEVLDKASARVRDLVLNMQRFSATEEVTFEEVDRRGVLRESKKASFSYVADIHEAAPQQLMVEEYRDDTVEVKKFPSRLATRGTAAFALILHPTYVKDFEVRCEGLSQWQGRRAWRLHLSQARGNNFRYYTVGHRTYAVMLKARAWIDAETFDVLRLETDLREPIPQIPLLMEHVIVEYAMVEFPQRNLQLWLPREADIYMDCLGRRYRHRHSFSHFQLFWVETEQTVKTPRLMATSEPISLPRNVPEAPPQEMSPLDAAGVQELSASLSAEMAANLLPTPVPFTPKAVPQAPPPPEAESQFQQGLIFHQDKKYGLAAEWYRKAAEQGVVRAQNNLAILYAQGKGVAQDYVAAHMWFAVAGTAKSDKNQANLRLLESQMTPEEIAEANRRAEEWLDRHALRADVTK